MVNLNISINNTLNHPHSISPFVIDFFSYLRIASNFLTDKIIYLLNLVNIKISQIGGGLILALVVVGLIMVVLKLSNQILKFIFFALLSLIIIGLFIPL